VEEMRRNHPKNFVAAVADFTRHFVCCTSST
jgi:hypothetical protein